jgi:hypothetical protein
MCKLELLHMKMAPFGICLWLAGSVLAEPLNRLSTFDSCEAFITSLRALKPQQESNIYSRALSIEDFGEGQPDGLIVPETVATVEEIWRSPDYALIFATARPKTEASPSEVAILITFRWINGSWSFSSLRRYQSLGKYARITCELTSTGHKPSLPGQDGSPAVLSFKRDSGGRGASESTSWSLLFRDGELYDQK